MMIGAIKTARFANNLCSLEDLIEMHLLVSKDSRIAPCLITHDKNFKYYLSEFVLRSARDFVFVGLLESEVIGFSSFKLLNDSIILNKIFIKQLYQGKGYGKVFLFESLKEILKTNIRERFLLDVFESNSMALNWYKRIGMEDQSKTYWYKIHPTRNFIKTSNNEITISPDAHGFTGLFLGKERIGSLINCRYLIQNPNHVIHFDYKSMRNGFVKADQKVENNFGCKFQELEISHRLSGNFKDIFLYLSSNRDNLS